MPRGFIVSHVSLGSLLLYAGRAYVGLESQPGGGLRGGGLRGGGLRGGLCGGRGLEKDRAGAWYLAV
jgi:hypothetical protein